MFRDDSRNYAQDGALDAYVFLNICFIISSELLPFLYYVLALLSYLIIESPQLFSERKIKFVNSQLATRSPRVGQSSV